MQAGQISHPQNPYLSSNVLVVRNSETIIKSLEKQKKKVFLIIEELTKTKHYLIEN